MPSNKSDLELDAEEQQEEPAVKPENQVPAPPANEPEPPVVEPPVVEPEPEPEPESAGFTHTAFSSENVQHIP